MIKLFDLDNQVIIPTVHAYTLKELRFLMDTYPDQYLKMFQYLFYMCCYNPEMNPFFNIKEDDREEEIFRQLQPEFSSEDEGLPEALAFCKKMYATPTLRAYLGIKIALDNIADYMAIAKPRDGKDGNIDSLTKTAEKFDKIRQSYKGTEKDLIEEQASRVRGGGTLSYDS